jgi:hypothetical protein
MGLFRKRPRDEANGPAGGGSPFTFDARAPETLAERAQLAYGSQNFSGAMHDYEKAIDLLHTLYLFENMRQRQPSPADAWIVDGYTSALGATLAMDSTAGVTESVRTVTHRLRTITTAADRVGLPSHIYRQGLDQMASYAPHVNVDDVYW